MSSFEIDAGGPHRLIDIDWTQRISKRRVFGPAASAELKYVASRPQTPADAYWRNICDIGAVSVSDIGFYFCRDVELRWPGLVHVDGELLAKADIHPDHHVKWRERNRETLSRGADRVRPIADVSLVLPLAGYDVYGHWILDFLPRAWLFSRQFGYDEAVNLVLPIDTPRYAREMLDLFLPNKFKINYVLYNIAEPVSLEFAVIPSLLHNDYNFHPVMNWFVQDVLALFVDTNSPAAKTPRKLFVSRSNLATSKRPRHARFVNERDLQNALENLGFATVYPQTMKWGDQLALFAQARVVVGAGGSGLHNCLFGPAGARVVCLNPNDRVSAGVCALRGQELCIVPTDFEDRVNDENIYSVDIDKVVGMSSPPEQAESPPLSSGLAYTRNFAARAQRLQGALASLSTQAIEMREQNFKDAQELKAFKTSLFYKIYEFSLGIRRRLSRIRRRTGAPGRSANPLFDEAYYFKAYADAKLSGLDGYTHYCQYGVSQGFNPNSSFDTLWYLANYPDVAQSGLNPLDHFYRFGASEGRATRAS